MLRNPEHLAIAHIVGSADVGGLERVVQSLAIAQRGSGHKVHVVIALRSADEPDAFITTLQSAGVACHAFRVRPKAYLMEYRSIIRFCRELNPDVVHTHGKRSDFLAGFAARQLGIPVVGTVHAAIRESFKNRFYMVLQFIALKKFDAVIPVARHIASRLRDFGIREERIHLVKNAWIRLASPISRELARKQLGIPSDAFAIGWIGRLKPEKGADLFVEALAQINDFHWIASIIGKGPDTATLRSKVEYYGLSSRVHLHGVIVDAGRLFTAFDCFVLSSHTEGTPIVLFEAMDARTPIIATRVGGVPDVISDSDALIVNPNDPGALANAIREVYVDHKGAEQRAESAYRRLENEFGIDPWIMAYDDIYRKILRR